MPVLARTVGIIADDLTGACDTALAFFRHGLKAEVSLAAVLEGERRAGTRADAMGLHAWQDTPIWSLCTHTRHLPAEQAVALVQQATRLLLEADGPDWFYKKVDSTCRGHLAQECLAMLDTLALDCAVLVPAFPAEKRQTVGGYHLLRCQPVELTEIARDPLYPVRQSHLPTLLASQLAKEQAEETIAHIPLLQVLRGAGPLVQAFKEAVQQGKRLLVVDANSQTDLEQIALALTQLAKTYSVLPCGSAGLAGVLGHLWFGPERADNAGSLMKHARPAAIGLDGTLAYSPAPVVLSGSNMPLNRQQLQRLIQHPTLGPFVDVIAPTPAQLLAVEPLTPALERLQWSIAQHRVAIVSTSLHEDTYDQTLALAREHALAMKTVASRIRETLHQLSTTVPHGRWVLCGGETAMQFCQSQAIHTLRLCDEIEPNMPLMRSEAGLDIVTKSGNFGDALTLVHIVQYLLKRANLSLPGPPSSPAG